MTTTTTALVLFAVSIATLGAYTAYTIRQTSKVLGTTKSDRKREQELKDYYLELIHH